MEMNFTTGIKFQQQKHFRKIATLSLNSGIRKNFSARAEYFLQAEKEIMSM